MPTRDACGSSSGSARVPARIRSAHNAWDARLTVGESSRERHHVEPRRRFLPWPPRLVSATRRGAAEAEACAGRARDQPAAWEGSHEAASPRRSEASHRGARGEFTRESQTSTIGYEMRRSGAFWISPRGWARVCRETDCSGLEAPASICGERIEIQSRLRSYVEVKTCRCEAAGAPTVPWRRPHCPGAS